MEYKLITDIKPYNKNAKKHPAKQVQQIANSIKEFGFNQPVVVDQNNEIIVGHGRFEAAKLLGLTEVPVIVLENLTPDQIKAYRLADNKLNESDWDMELVIEELKGLDSQGFDISLTGFEKDLILEPSDGDDQFPENVQSRAKLGDIWLLGEHRLMCGDATVLSNIEALMAGKKADMVFTDPPYNVDYTGGTGLKIQNDSFKHGDFYQFLLDALNNMRAFVRGDVYIVMSSSELHTLYKAFTDAGGHWSTFLIWVKDRFALGRSNYQRQYEPILYGWFDGSSHYWSGRRNLGNVIKEQLREDIDGSVWLKVENEQVETDVWEFDKPNRNKQHPTMKPVALMERAIINSSLPGNIVLDIFAGSGSTLIAAEKTGCICYAMELDPKYVDVIIQRYEKFSGKQAHLEV